MQEIVAPLGFDIEARDVEWEELPLHGSLAPIADLSKAQVVHLVSAGGIDNQGVEHGRAPIGLAAFVDLASAEAFAASERQTDPTVVVRSVPLSTPLTAA